MNPTGPEADAAPDAQEALAAEVQWYRTLFEQGPVPMIIYDPETLTILAANLATARLYGYRAQVFDGMNIAELAADSLEEVHRRNAGLPAEATIIGVLPHRRRDDTVFQAEITSQAIDYQGRPVRLAVILDVTERQEAEVALRRSEARFRALVENSSEGVILLDAGGRILYATSAITMVLGLDPEIIAGRPARDFVHPEDQARVTAQLAESLAHPGVPIRHEARYRHRDGGWRHLEVVRANHLDDPAVGAMVSHFRDVTDRRELEARLRVADRMASVGTLAAGVAHEINNPLAYVLANLGFVAEMLEPHHRVFGADADEVFAALEEARSGGERVREIVRDLKTFSRSEPRRGPVDVHAILDGMCAMAHNEIRHRARLEKDYALMLPFADGDESHLGQVFLNLLVNAAQAIPEEEGDRHTIGVRTRVGDDGWIEVEVSDDGVGIPEEVRGRIFNPFFTTKPVGVGTGLGLSICRNLITGDGGEIEVESERGQGTTFRVRLPRSQGETRPEASDAAGPATPTGPRGRILVIDDEPLIGRAVRRILGVEHEVVVVPGAAAALERLGVEPTFDLLLCDVMMPEMSGMELWAALEAVAPWARARTVFMTGGAFTPAAAAFLQTVDVPRVDKPFDARALKALVRDRMAGAATADEAG